VGEGWWLCPELVAVEFTAMDQELVVVANDSDRSWWRRMVQSKVGGNGSAPVSGRVCSSWWWRMTQSKVVKAMA